MLPLHFAGQPACPKACLSCRYGRACSIICPSAMKPTSSPCTQMQQVRQLLSVALFHRSKRRNTVCRYFQWDDKFYIHADASVSSKGVRKYRQHTSSNADLHGQPKPAFPSELQQSPETQPKSPPLSPAAAQHHEPGDQQAALEHLSDSKAAAAGRGEHHPRSKKAIQDKGWRGIYPGSVLEGHHRVRTWMGVGTFLTLEPSSYSRRILNDQVNRPQSRCMLGLHCRPQAASWHSIAPLVSSHRFGAYIIAAWAEQVRQCKDTLTIDVSESHRLQRIPA